MALGMSFPNPASRIQRSSHWRSKEVLDPRTWSTKSAVREYEPLNSAMTFCPPMTKAAPRLRRSSPAGCPSCPSGSPRGDQDLIQALGSHRF